jgi:hypothetical protein
MRTTSSRGSAADVSRSNCLLFAIALYLRRARRGDAGYVAIRRSKYGMFPHFMYLHRGRRFISYCPIDPRHKVFPPPLFRGRVKWGDE